MTNEIAKTENSAPVRQNALGDPEKLAALTQFAAQMAESRVSIPQHLIGKPADCLAVTMQAAEWGMNPFAVAQKTHLINGTLGYEAQLVNAVITSMSPTTGRLNYDWFGPWERVVGNFKTLTGKSGKSYQAPAWSTEDEAGCGVRVWATLRGETEPRVLELLLSQATVRNSTLWASDPKQQLAYLATKRWARLYTPDVILGVYTPDELRQREPIDVTPVQVDDDATAADRLKRKIAGSAADNVDDAAVREVDGVNDAATREQALNLINSCNTLDELIAVADEIKSAGVKDLVVRTAWAERRQAIMVDS